MNARSVPCPVFPAPGRPLGAGGHFTQGFVAAGCLSAFQDHPSTQSSADLKRVLRHALQGGAALAAGNQAAQALYRRHYSRALATALAGAAGVLLIEQLLRDAAPTAQEIRNGEKA